MAINTLQEKFMHGLGDIYDAEHQFLDGQQEMLANATGESVKQMLTQHIAQTEQQIANLEQAFQALGEEAERVKCAGAAGLVKEAQQIIKETSGNPELCDLAIASAAFKVEHYEISCYRGLIAAAQAMNQTRVVSLLQENLQQEEQTAQRIEQNTPMMIQQAMGADGSATRATNA